MWASREAGRDDLTEQKQEVCFGPQRRLQQLDRATTAEAKFVASHEEGAKFARDSIVHKHVMMVSPMLARSEPSCHTQLLAGLQL